MAHARMTECVLSVCVHPDVHVWSRGFGHLPVGRDPLCAHEERGNERAEKKSFAGHREGRREIKGERRAPASFAD